MVQELRERGETILNDGASSARKQGVEADTELLDTLEGPGAAIVEVAEKWQADLIVIGTHGRRGIRRLVMGSDAEYVVRKHTCAGAVGAREQTPPKD